MAAACGGGGGDDTTTGTSEVEGTPTPGGSVVYGIEAETSGGWCLPEAQLALSGIQVARAMFETLTVPNEAGEYVPFLAKSVTHNATYDEWTITLRDGITFQDGSPLTAEVVKNNLDAYQNRYPTRHPVLASMIKSNWGPITAAGPHAVKVKTLTPWPAFPAYLYGNGRVGIIAQAQLDDTQTCTTKPIGTGPFELKEWKVNQRLVVVKNPSYWRQGLPYLDEIEFRPMLEASQRINALQTGEIDLTHTMNPLQVADLRALAESGEVGLVQSDKFADVTYTLLNVSKPPFDNILARRAFATAVDNQTLDEVRYKGIPKDATGPFPPGTMGYLADTGLPTFDLAEAKKLVKQYEDETGQKLRFTISSTPEPTNIETAQMVKEMAGKAGIEIDLKQTEEASLINEVLGGNFDAVFWRNHAGGDPDLQYLWWKSDSPVNFGRFKDPEIDRLLDAGRVETDPATREKIYEDVNHRFADRLWNLWGTWSMWSIGTSPNVHGVLGPDLPDGSKPFPGLADGHPLTGLWVEP